MNTGRFLFIIAGCGVLIVGLLYADETPKPSAGKEPSLITGTKERPADPAHNHTTQALDGAGGTTEKHHASKGDSASTKTNEAEAHSNVKQGVHPLGSIDDGGHAKIRLDGHRSITKTDERGPKNVPGVHPTKTKEYKQTARESVNVTPSLGLKKISPAVNNGLAPGKLKEPAVIPLAAHELAALPTRAAHYRIPATAAVGGVASATVNHAAAAITGTGTIRKP